MANKIVLKKSSVAAKVPLSTDLEVGEIAVNLTDQKLYSKKSDGTVILVGSGVSGGGDVVGPASATDNALARFNSTTGKLIQNSTVTLDDNGNTSNVNSIVFDITPTTPATAAGTMYWDAGNQTPSIILNPDVELQLGQENVALVYNGTGSTIPNGAVVAVNGAQGQRPSVALADADNEALSAPTLGIATQSIANGAEGFITTFGFVRGLDTSGFTAGLPIYLSQTAGQFTQTRPAAPAHTVALGWVIKVNASSGEVFVNINNGWELDELHNVLITSPTSGNTLIYDASANVWKNANITAGTGISVTNGAGSITVANTGVTSVGGTGTVNGVTLTGTVTTSGNLTLGGTLSGVSLTTQVSGTLPIANGGTNATTAADARTNLDVPTRTGGNASGTWGINVTGTSASISGFNNPSESPTANTIVYRTVNGDIACREVTLSSGLSGSVPTVLVSMFPTTNQMVRTTPDAVMQAIRGAANGTWGINITGNAATATNINSTQPNIGYSISGQNIEYGGQGGPQIQSQGGGAAMMSFHRPGAYAINFGLGTDNQLRTGGWSRGGNHVILDSGNYSGYAIPVSGGINMSGSYGLNDQRLYLRTNGDTNHYLWNAGDDWEELVAFYGSGFRVQASNGVTLMTFSTSSNTTYRQLKSRYATSSGDWGFVLGETNAMPTDRGILIQNSAGSAIPLYFTVNNGGTVSGSVVASGGSTTYNTSSDYRMKENDININKDFALSKIMSLRPITFNWKKEHGGAKGIGFYAHELQEKAPECVHGKKDDVNEDGTIKPQGVDASFLIPTICSAMQKQQELIEQLKAEVATLKGN